jgi:hypothetical protein
LQGNCSRGSMSRPPRSCSSSILVLWENADRRALKCSERHVTRGKEMECPQECLLNRITPDSMFGIKLVSDYHFSFPYFGLCGNPAVMNFPDSREGREIATVLPVGHRALVYLMAPKKCFGAAIEFIQLNQTTGDLLDDGMQAARAQDAIRLHEAVYPHWAKWWRCTRVIAWKENPTNVPGNAPTPDFHFQKGDDMFDISERCYSILFNAICWNWQI